MKDQKIRYRWTLGMAALAIACSDGTSEPGPSLVGGAPSAAGGNASVGGNAVSNGGKSAPGGGDSLGGGTVSAGGTNAGGQAFGGSAVGGTSESGGASIGGKAAGGANASGGRAAGGSATGGAAMGGKAAGGANIGGVAAGGKAAGGAGTGGSATGGLASGGTAGSAGGTGKNAPVPSLGCGKSPTLKSGTISLQSASLARQYIIDIPSDYDNSKPYRLIFGFHWIGGTMTDVATGQTVLRNVWSYFGLKQLDTPRSAIFVAPQGIDNGWANTNGRDLTFTDDMVKQITEDLCIDKSRIFAGGFSYGGMWSSTLACQRPDVFRALAPQNGSGSCSNQKPVAFFGAGSNDGTNVSLLNYARTIATANGCSNPKQEVPLPATGSLLHTCTSFTGCPAAYPVRFCAFDQKHKAAPFDGGCAECDDGNKTWVPKEVWSFYTQF